MIPLLFSLEDAGSMFSKKEFKISVRLTSAFHFYSEKTAVFLDHAHMWLLLCITEAGFIDGTENCAHAVISVMTESCLFFNAVLSEGLNTTIQ